VARLRTETPETTANEAAEPAPLARRPARRPAPAAAPPRPGAAREGGPRGAARRRPEEAATSGQLGQILTLVGLAASSFVALSLATWSPTDASLSVANPSGATMNWCGPIGAYTADALYQAFGWGSWSVLVVGAWFGLKLAGRVSQSVWNVVLGGFALWMVATALDLGIGHEGARAFPPGGLVGVLTGNALLGHVGRAGGAIGVTTGLLAALTALFGINWQPIAAATVDRVQSGTPKVGRFLGAATVAAGRGALAVTARAGESLRDRFTRAPEPEVEEWEEEEPEVVDEGPWQDAGPATATPDALATMEPAPALPARRAALPERAPAPPTEDLPSVHGSVWSAAPPPPRDGFTSPQPERPTRVGARTLVEVELDPDTSFAAGTSRAAVGRVQTTPADPVAPSLPPRAAAAPVRPPVLAADDYDVPPARAAAPGPAVFAHQDEEVDVFEDSLPGGAAPQAEERPTNAFGMGPLSEEPPARTLAPPPVAVERPFAAEVVELGPAADAIPGRQRGKKTAAVMPGNLRSGGVNDDGGAIRESNTPFQLPPLGLLDEHPAIVGATNEGRLRDLAAKLTAKLSDFGVEGRVSAIRPGPVITMFEYEPAPGIKLSKIASLADDVAMAMKATAIRIVAPLPGRGVVGVEVPNESRQTVWARDVFASSEFRDQRHTLPIMLGKDTEGRPYVADLARTPHLLVGGTTGSGKSVGINAMLVSLLMTRTPEELRLILVDPKMLEFELYKEIPHLLHPVVTNAALASKVLAWACEEMDRRYRMLGDWQVRNIENFNSKVEVESADWTAEKARMYYPDWPPGTLLPTPRKLPYIVVVIDELADLMMVAGKDVETSIARIAQKARASGIHLIVATQRPSADVVTGLIRSNMPSRLAYQVRTAAESRIILDAMGANALLGKGDLLFVPPGVSALTRIHGPFLSDEEVKRVADYCRAQGKPNYAPAIRLDDSDGGDEEIEELDEEMSRYYDEILDIALEKGQISTSMIQRHLKLGYNRACTLMEQLERNGIVGPADGAKPRKVVAQD
jgi:S-DNA-T family DNA segregation ATPase FtsK/SpoIIIE